MTRATGGFYYGATEGTEAESLRLLGEALGMHTGAAVPPRFTDWDEAIRYLFTTRFDGPTVIDELPYLIKAAPVIPSILQRELDRGASAGTSLSLLLCGSAMSVMGGLLSGSAPLRGRANLELIVRPFAPARLAFLLHSVVGGTPAYRRFVNDDAPDSLDDFDDWVMRTVLDPATPLFREARYLLDEEADVRDSALYHSVLAAVAAGNSTRGGIASSTPPGEYLAS